MVTPSGWLLADAETQELLQIACAEGFFADGAFGLGANLGTSQRIANQVVARW
jgi:hypothetical protein